MPTQDELSAIADRLKQGYFLKADMDALGMSGYVSLDDVRAKIKALLMPVQPVAQDNTQAEAERAQKAQEQLQAGIKAQQDRMAIIDAIEAHKQAQVQAAADQKALQETIERFQAAIKADPNVKTTP